LAAANYTRA